jgi:hypothetical protein
MPYRDLWQSARTHTNEGVPMKDKNKLRYGSRYLALMIAFLLLVIATLGYLLV